MLVDIIKKYWRKNLVALVLTAIESGGIILSTVFLAQIMNGLIEKNQSKFIRSFITSLFLWGVALLFGYLKQRYVESVKQQQIIELREKIIVNVSNSSFEIFHLRNSNEYISWLTNDMNIIEEQGLGNLYSGMSSATLLAFSAIAIYNFNWILLLLSVLISMIMFIIPKFFKHRLDFRNKAVSKTFELYVSKVDEWVRGFDLLLSYNKTNMIIEKLRGVNEAVKKEKIDLKKEKSILNTLIRLISVLAQYGIILVTGVMVLFGHLKAGTIFAIGDLTGNFFGNTSFFMEEITNFLSAISITEKIENFIYSKKDEEFPVSKEYNFSEKISVKNVSYCYGDKNIQIPNMSFLKTGKYAIVGKSGTGKSTFLNILTRNLTKYKGSIYFDEQELSEIDLHEFRNNITYIPQKSYVFDMSLEENLSLESSFTESEINLVIKDMDLVEQAKIYKASLGIQGTNLSGGQAQRVELGRGILHAKDVLIIDEGTSNLDLKTSYMIEKNILMNTNLTVIFVTHHLNDELRELFNEVYTFS